MNGLRLKYDRIAAKRFAAGIRKLSIIFSKGGFPQSRYFYVRTYVNFNWLYVRKQNRDDL